MYKNTLVLFFLEAAKIVLYIILILSIIKGKIAVSLLISYFENLGECSRTIASSYMSIMEESISFYRILDIINYDGNKITFGSQNIDLIKGKIELKNVFFKLTNDFSLSNISFKVNQNELTAIVGPLGSGKTTIFNLILRFYKPSKGEILLDDINILDYAKDIYSSNVSVVNQKAFLFNMSIKDNLSLIEKSFKKQVEVCKKVGIHNFIMSLKDGYNTILENDGKNISGGQKQLLSLARALLTNAEVILFDEITSSLDPKTTNEVIKLLHQLKKDHTIIVITHNKDLMCKADKIIVLNKGKVVGIGIHNDLIEKNKVYKKLYQNGINYICSKT